MKKLIEDNKSSSAFLLLWKHISKRRRKQFLLLLTLMFVSSLFEVISLGAVLPFLAALVAPEQVFKYPLIQPLINFFELTHPNQIILPLTLVFVAAAFAAGFIRLTLLYVMTRLTYATGADLNFNIYQRTLYQDYAIHVSRNSSEVINGITSKTNTVTAGVISPIIGLISSSILLVAVMSVLLAINAVVAISAFIGFGLVYLVLIQFTRRYLKFNSKLIADQSTKVVKSLQEGLGGIRDVLIDGSQQFYIKLFRSADLPIRRASGNNSFISSGPRFVIEAVGIMLIAILAYLMFQKSKNPADVIPVLGALAIGAQRLLPAIQNIYGSFTTIKGSKASLDDVIKLLEQPLPEFINKKSNPIPFINEIVLRNISFRYMPDAPFVLKGVNLNIKKGDHIGFIGTTGSGKSTLLDLIMGLLVQTSGEILIDGKVIDDHNRRGWQANIAHVPQNIFLSDSTIEENIAFGISKDKIDSSLVKKAAKKAQITELIESWEQGYQTIVGERGVRLSGGQRQRIGIARALYKQANVLIFDEATSALDNQTEKKIINTINHLDKDLTILIIAHRITTLKQCNQIIEVSESGGLSLKQYDEIIRSN
jgi:ATP-binding cassette subfamily B protein